MRISCQPCAVHPPGPSPRRYAEPLEYPPRVPRLVHLELLLQHDHKVIGPPKRREGESAAYLNARTLPDPIFNCAAFFAGHSCTRSGGSRQRRSSRLQQPTRAFSQNPGQMTLQVCPGNTYRDQKLTNSNIGDQLLCRPRPECSSQRWAGLTYLLDRYWSGLADFIQLLAIAEGKPCAFRASYDRRRNARCNHHYHRHCLDTQARRSYWWTEAHPRSFQQERFTSTSCS